MSEDKLRNRWQTIGKSMIVEKLRSVANGIEKGNIELDTLTLQELDSMLSQIEKGTILASDFLMPIEDLDKSLREFSTGIQQATNAGKLEERD